MANPNTTRSAAYLATRERLDAKRRTSGKVQCIAPNRVCGGRCIPPEWDCRLKGEGEDPHLRAVGKGSDPVGGLASIERGFARIGKGVGKLSFSEIEGGRKALARGTAKLSPGDIKKKEEIKKKVDVFLGRVLIPASALVGAALLHRGLKNFKGYREGTGRQVDDAASAAINLVRTNIPGYGERVRQRQAVGVAAVRSTAQANQNIRTRSPDNIQPSTEGRSLTPIVQAQVKTGDPNLTSALNRRISKGDSLKGPNGTNRSRSFSEWEERSLTEFWSTRANDKIAPSAIGSDSSIFSVHATNTLLSRSFGFPDARGVDIKADSNNVISRLSTYLRTTGESVRTTMREYGMDPRKRDQIESFIERTADSSKADDVARNMLIQASFSTDYDTQARKLYRDTAQSYDKLFNNVLEEIRSGAGQNPRGTYYNDALQAHSSFLNRRLALPEPVYGSNTGQLVRRAYHARFIAPRSRLRSNANVSVRITPSAALNAGIEIAKAKGLPEPKTAAEGLRLVREAYGGVGGLGLISTGSDAAPKAPPRTSTASGAERPARRRNRSRPELVAMLMRSGRSKQAAETEADRIIANRRSDARVDAYLCVRNDFTPPGERKGKPCGESFVPKQQKCTKPTTARYVDPAEAKKEQEGPGIGRKLATGAAVAGVAAVGALAFKNRKSIQRVVSTGRNVIKNEKASYNTILKAKRAETNDFGRPKYSAEAAARVARKEYVQSRREAIRKQTPLVAEETIQRLSSDKVKSGIAKLPQRFQEPVRNMVGYAKKFAATTGLKADGFEMVSVNQGQNYATYKAKNGTVASVGSYGDAVVIYHSQFKGKVKSVDKYGMAFTVDRRFDQRKDLDPAVATDIKKATTSMFKDQISALPDNAFIFNKPYKDDGRGKAREAAYKRQGFRTLPKGDEMWAIKDAGKFRKLSDEELSALMAILTGRRDAADPKALPIRVLSFQLTKRSLSYANA